MKKQVSAILAASMAASMLVACGGSTSSAATSTATAESTSTASSEAAPAESTADAGQAADIQPVLGGADPGQLALELRRSGVGNVCLALHMDTAEQIHGGRPCGGALHDAHGIAARAAGVQCFDTVFTNLDDMETFEKETELIHLMGFDGKSLVNPRQIPITHKVFTPTQKEITFAEKVVAEIDSKKSQGIGVFTVDGKMIDIAFYDGAKRVLMLAKAAGIYGGELV